ncbi:hypothetical protein [Mesorhizobium escarrei]|uniref:hypothetical protein n=1 Tax=Mesorhizobium escarrei TaxID=666018 RepID=UPI003F52F0A1
MHQVPSSPPPSCRWRGLRLTDTPVNETLVRDITTDTFIADQRDAVLIAVTGTSKSHPRRLHYRSLARVECAPEDGQ